MNISMLFFLPWRNISSGPKPPHYRGFMITLSYTLTTLGRTPLGEISPTQRPLPGNTQHSQERDVHVPGGIRTRNPSKRAAADTRLRPRGQWDRLCYFNNSKTDCTIT